jgi:hypothetical protein
MLAAKEDHLVFEQRTVDRRDGLAVEILCEPHSVDARTDGGAQFHHVDGFSHRSIPTRDICAVNDLAGREQNYRPDGKNVKSVNTSRGRTYRSAIRAPESRGTRCQRSAY